MFLVRLLYRIYLVGAYLGLWRGLQYGGDDAAVHGHLSLAPPVVGVSMRQGRRFYMEDRAVHYSSVLPAGHFCHTANYTYAAGE